MIDIQIGLEELIDNCFFLRNKSIHRNMKQPITRLETADSTKWSGNKTKSRNTQRPLQNATTAKEETLNVISTLVVRFIALRTIPRNN